MEEKEDYQGRLSQLQFHVTQEKWTEPPFTGEYLDTKEHGIYHCVCCDSPLFSSDTKFDSGTGWPSFWDPIDGQGIVTSDDHSLGMSRTEVMCAKCNAHSGHVFEDGPLPTGLRYCMNSASLHHEPDLTHQ